MYVKIQIGCDSPRYYYNVRPEDAPRIVEDFMRVYLLFHYKPTQEGIIATFYAGKME